MASPTDVNEKAQRLEKIRVKLFVFPGYRVEGECWVHNRKATAKDGYPRETYHHPETNRKTSSTVANLAVKYYRKDFDTEIEVSHLCNVKNCIREEHLVVESHQKNCSRKTCVKEGRCLGHRDAEECIFKKGVWSGG